MVAEGERQGKGSFSWKVLECLYAGGNCSEGEDVVTRKREGRVDEGKTWGRQEEASLRKRGRVAV